MPTNRLPIGTVNFPVNLPAELRAKAGRLAAMQGKALGAWLREMLEEQVQKASQVGAFAEQQGQRVLRFGVAVVFAAGAAAVIHSVIQPDTAIMARRQFRRVRREEVLV